MGIPTGLQFSITAIGSMVMQSANNGLGSVYVSAFTAAMKIKQFMMCPFDSDQYRGFRLLQSESRSRPGKTNPSGTPPGCALSVSAMVRLQVSS